MIAHAEQSDQLNRVIDEDEPRGKEDMDEDVEFFAWFSDEEFVGGSDINEVGELLIRRTDAGGPNASSSGVLQLKTAAGITWYQPASCRRSLKKRDSPGFHTLEFVWE
ncbi:hypothetical protein FB451DRAFT_1366298, partial [Mycena latifolia]